MCYTNRSPVRSFVKSVLVGLVFLGAGEGSREDSRDVCGEGVIDMALGLGSLSSSSFSFSESESELVSRELNCARLSESISLSPSSS